MVRIHLFFNSIRCQQVFVTNISFIGRIYNLTLLVYRIGIRFPVIFGIVYYTSRYRLADNVFHDFLYHLLFFKGIGKSRIIGFDFIPKVPVRQQYHIFRKKPPAIFGQQITHHDIIGSYIVFGITRCTRHFLVQTGRGPVGEQISHPGISPLFSVPPVSQCIFFFKAVIWKIQNTDKRNFIGIHIVREMCGRSVISHDQVYLRKFFTLKVNWLFECYT